MDTAGDERPVGSGVAVGADRPRTAVTVYERLRFLGFARNHYGLAKAARGDVNGVLPAGWELYMSSVPSPAPRPHGYRLSPVRRRGGWQGYFHSNDKWVESERKFWSLGYDGVGAPAPVGHRRTYARVARSTSAVTDPYHQTLPAISDWISFQSLV